MSLPLFERVNLPSKVTAHNVGDCGQYLRVESGEPFRVAKQFNGLVFVPHGIQPLERVVGPVGCRHGKAGNTIFLLPSPLPCQSLVCPLMTSFLTAFSSGFLSEDEDRLESQDEEGDDGERLLRRPRDFFRPLSFFFFFFFLFFLSLLRRRPSSESSSPSSSSSPGP